MTGHTPPLLDGDERRPRRHSNQTSGFLVEMATYSAILCDSEWVTVAIYTARFE